MKRASGQVRANQVITTFGPGALIDLPRDSAIVGGLDSWPKLTDLMEITEARLSRKLELMTGVKSPRLYAPPPASDDPRQPSIGIVAWRFPEWFVVQESSAKDDPGRRERSRRLVHRKALDEKRRFDGLPVVATRFVRACPRGHIDDIDWRGFVHGSETSCRRQLWLDERGTSGDLAELVVRCECKKTRPMYEASEIERNALGVCSGGRPWLGPHASEACKLHARLLVRTASNAYFPQVVSVLSLPDRGSDIERVVRELWDDLQIVDDAAHLSLLKKKPKVTAKLAAFGDAQVLEAIQNLKGGAAGERPVKEVELEAILAAPEGYGEDIPRDPDFHARRLPDEAWRRGDNLAPVQAVFQLHRLREVMALSGFSRFEAAMPDPNGEYETDVERAAIQIEPSWFPAVENRGEGVFIQLHAPTVSAWMAAKGTMHRVSTLEAGHAAWASRREIDRPFPGGPYILLHTLAHLLIQAVSTRAGYSVSSIRERIYSDVGSSRYGILLYTGSSDAEGTLGGLVDQGRRMSSHLVAGLEMAALCSNDPICAQHSPEDAMEQRWLHGAACHGCALISETSCEMRNEYLDRSLVVPTLGVADASFFSEV